MINFYFLTDKRTNSSSNVTFQPCIEICFSIILLHVQSYSAKIPAHHKTVQEVEVLFSSTARSYLSSAIKDSYFSGLTSEAAREVENGRASNLTASVNNELIFFPHSQFPLRDFRLFTCLIFIMINSMNLNSHFYWSLLFVMKSDMCLIFTNTCLIGIKLAIILCLGRLAPSRNCSNYRQLYSVSIPIQACSLYRGRCKK